MAKLGDKLGRLTGLHGLTGRKHPAGGREHGASQDALLEPLADACAAGEPLAPRLTREESQLVEAAPDAPAEPETEAGRIRARSLGDTDTLRSFGHSEEGWDEGPARASQPQEASALEQGDVLSRVQALRSQLAAFVERKREPKLKRPGPRFGDDEPEQQLRLQGRSSMRRRAFSSELPWDEPDDAAAWEKGFARALGIEDEACGSGAAFIEEVTGPLPGECEDTPHGPVRYLRVLHDEDHCHGVVPVSLALEARGADLAVLALDPKLESIDFTRALFIDTETTGLMGGAGTLPFLIGLAWFEGRRLVVEQLLLERPGLEAPMLQRLGHALARASCIVSYNGKSFDWPLLRTRFILNRVAAPEVPAHLDLLHCARRVYKRRLGAVRLINLEQTILGFERIDDMPGELIPQTYLGYLRGQLSGAALGPILEHNRSDLVALAAILGELVRRFRGEHPAQDARDQLGFASVAARASDHARALTFARGAIDADVRGELACEALYLTGELKARAGDYEGALEAFNEALEFAQGHTLAGARTHLALAKLWEHKLKDCARALEHARHTAAAEGADCSARRVVRLERKLAVKGPLSLGLESE